MSTNNHNITLAEAITLTHAYQSKQLFEGLTRASYIDANAYQQIIDQEGCVGIRTYFALNESNKLTIVVGVDANGNDMTNGVLLNHALDCPTVCPVNSPLIQTT